MMAVVSIGLLSFLLLMGYSLLSIASENDPDK